VRFASISRSSMPPRSDEESGSGDDSAGGDGSRRSALIEVSLTDPQAAWVASKGTDPFFAYDANYLIDNKAGIMVDAGPWSIASNAASAFGPGGSQAIVFMVRSGCLRRWGSPDRATCSGVG
jgi:hypothetical protein